MIGGRAWWRHIGGPNAISVWAVLITVPLGLVVSFFTGNFETVQTAVITLVAVLIGHCAAAALAFLAWLTYLRPGTRPNRPWIALATFTALGICRAVVTHLALLSSGLETGMALPTRVALGAVFGAVTLSAIAVLVGESRTSREARDRLIVAAAALASTRELDQARIDELERQYRAEVATVITQRLTELRNDRAISAAESVAAVRQLSEGVVRPLSHKVLRDRNEIGFPRREPISQGSSPTLRRMLTTLRPPDPLVLTVTFVALALVFLFNRLAPSLAVLTAVTCGLMLFLGSYLARKYFSATDTRASVGVLRLVASYALIAAGTIAIQAWILWFTTGTAIVFWIALMTFPAIALMLSVINRASELRTADELSLAESLNTEAELTRGVERRLDVTRERIAQLLHSSVQSELLALSLGARNAGDASAGLSARIDEAITCIHSLLVSPKEQPAASAEQRVGRLMSLWSAALAIELTAPPEIWTVLDGSLAQTEALIAVLSEGLTNAVRHGAERTVSLDLSVVNESDIGLTLKHRGILQSDGAAARAASGGVGLSHIDLVSKHWSLSGDAGVVALSCII